MAFVRMPDGTRRKVERIDEDDAKRDLAEILAIRDGARPDSPRRQKKVTFAEVLEAWFKAGAPNVPSAEKNRLRHAKVKADTTLDRIRGSIDNHLVPNIGALWVDATGTARLEKVFTDMDKAGLSTSTINKSWQTLNTGVAWGKREGLNKTNPASDCILPEARAPRERKSLTLEEATRLIEQAIPQDPRPAMWLTTLMCGLRPGEMLGLRWCYLDLDSDAPAIHIKERAHYRKHRYVGQAPPKRESDRDLELHPLLVAALLKHREEQKLLDRYRYVEGEFVADGFVFPTSNLTPMLQSNARRAMASLFQRAGIGVGDCPEHDECSFKCKARPVEAWTTYELRHSFVSLADDALENLRLVADAVGHVDTKTTMGYRHTVKPALPHAVNAWNRLLDNGQEEAS